MKTAFSQKSHLRINKIFRTVIILIVILLTPDRSDAAYPSWGTPVTGTLSNITATFKVPVYLVSGGKVRFSLSLYCSGTYTCTSYTVRIFEDDLVDTKLFEETINVPSGSVSGTFYNQTKFTSDPVTELVGSSEELYAEVKFTLVFSSTLSTSSTSSTIYRDDSYENNDSFGTAYTLSSNGFYGNMIWADDDYYKFTPVSGYLNYTLKLEQFFNVAGDFDLYLYNSSQTLLASSTSSNDYETITYILPSVGTYYLKVGSYDGGKGFYDLRLEATCVSPPQPGPISGPTTVCPYSTNTYSISPVSGATSYTWTLPSGWSGSSTSTSISATTGANGGTISVKANNSCNSGPVRTLVVSTYSLPSQPGSISGPSPVCLYTSNTYSISPVSGATSYTWTLPSGWTGSSTSTSITATSGTSGGTISVSANGQCGSGPSSSRSVSVTNLPSTPGTISGPSSVCQGNSYTYSISAVSGASYYTWYIPSGWSGNSTTTSITVVAGSNGGKIEVDATNSCGTGGTRSLSVSVSPVLQTIGSISGNTTVCQGSSQTYTVPSVAGATSYTWTLPSGWTGSSTTNSITAIIGSTGGTISVKANNSCGSSPTASMTATVTQIPAQPGPITGSTSVCQGSGQTYSVSAVSGATSYTWILPSGWTGSSTANSITATAGSTGGTISVRANNSCGSSSSSSLTVTVSQLPAQPGPISGNTTLCQGSSQTYSVSPVSGATSYTWTLPSGWTGSSTANSITAAAGSAGGTISVRANNSCGSGSSSSLSVTVTQIPGQPGAITGNTSVCAGSVQTYSISPVTGATSYIWTLPSGWTGSSTTTSISVTVGSGGGNVAVRANNTCGSSMDRILAVTTGIVPGQPGVITGASAVCQGSAQTYSVPAVTGAASYTWTLPTGWTGSSTTNSITTTAGITGGNITVTANSFCGSSTPRSLSVTVTLIPGTPGSITGNTTVCQGSSQTYSVPSVTGATSYTWTLPSGWTGSSTTSSITATAGSAGGTISVRANNSCGSGSSSSLSVTVTQLPGQPGPISGSSGTVCQGLTLTLTIPAVAGATSYTWTLPSGWTGSSTTNSITVTVGSTGGTISVKANNSCGSGPSSSGTVTVTPLPSQPGSITGSNAVCQGSSQTYTIQAVTGATSYTWTLPSGWTGSSTTNSITATVGSAGGTISVRANNSCGSGASASLAVSVSRVPVQPGPITGNTSVSSGTEHNYKIDPVPGATSYIWTLPVGWSGSQLSTAEITVTTGATGGTITVKASNVCGISPASSLNVVLSKIENEYESGKIKVYPNPATEIVTILNLSDIDNLRMELLNSNGKVVHSSEIISDRITIDVSSYSNGFYILRFIDKESSFTVKLIKQ